MKYYLIAGERSGDLHGGNLIKSLKVLDQQGSFQGFGGSYMASQGMRVDKHYKDLAFMGFWEVLVNLFKIKKYLNEAKSAILKYNPDVVILIDYGGFNLKIASFLKSKEITCYYYITPKVWAWNQGRANKIKRLVDRMFVILPFEKTFYKRFSWDVDYVGNPVLDAIKQHEPAQITFANVGKPIVAFLPGSRLQEIRRVSAVVRKVIIKNPQWHFVIARVDNIDQSVYSSFETLDNVEFLTGRTYDLLAQADAAIVTSGTATLEAALFKVPQVVIYATSALSYLIGRALIKVNYISLVNLIADKKVVTELIQQDFSVDRLSQEVSQLLDNHRLRKGILDDYHAIEKELNVGSASRNTARLIVQYLQQH